MSQATIERATETRAVGAWPRLASWAVALEAGAVTGASGAVLMLAVLMAQGAVTGYGALFPLNMIGATFRGPEALVGGASVILWGLFLHAVASLFFGILFSVAVIRKPHLAPTLMVGIAYGLLILLFMNYVVLPYANPIMRQRVISTPGSWFFAHVAFGLGVGMAPLIKRLFGTRRGPDGEPVVSPTD